MAVVGHVTPEFAGISFVVLAERITLEPSGTVVPADDVMVMMTAGGSVNVTVAVSPGSETDVAVTVTETPVLPGTAGAV